MHSKKGKVPAQGWRQAVFLNFSFGLHVKDNSQKVTKEVCDHPAIC